MRRLAITISTLWAALAATFAGLSGCGSEQDDRPAKLDYIVVTVLRPACGTASCHSTLTKTAGYAFDTLEAARDAFGDYKLVVPGDPEASKLWKVLVGNKIRMPPDGPIPDADLSLIENWILDGGDLN